MREERPPASDPSRLVDGVRLLLLHRDVLEQHLPRLDEVVRARPARLPAVRTRGEVQGVLRRAGIPKRATCLTLRHSSATHLLEGGATSNCPGNAGHRDASTNMPYTHVLNRGPAGVPSSADWMASP